MDLKSIMNDSAVPRPPRIHTSTHSYSHTPQSSYDARSDQTPSSDVSSARPTPHGPPLHSIESRMQGGGGGQGGYFAIQSPHPNTSASASTPVTGPLSAYSQSPGTYPQSSTPKDGLPPSYNTYNGAFVSPSTSVHHPHTPGSASHPGYHHTGPYASSTHTPNYQQFQSPPPPQQLNGLPPSAAHARQISPTAHFQAQPATPLGPPIHYPKISPHSHRPLSQGQEQHLRRASQSSIGSAHSQHPSLGPIESVRRESVQKSYTHELRERERSISVSPKTIPRAPPSREQSMQSRTSSHGQPSHPPQLERQTSSRQSISLDPTESVMISQTLHAPPVTLSSPTTTKPSSVDRNFYPSPAPEPIQEPSVVLTPSTARTMVERTPTVLDGPDAKQPVLKRSASHLSDSPQRRPPKKRLRREDIPRWAQSARGDRKLNFIEGKSREYHRPHPNLAPQRVAPVSRPVIVTSNGDDTGPPAQPARRSQPPEPVQPVNVDGLHWETTLADIVPHEDLTRMLCDFILHYVRDAVPPKNSFFEIEAKIGQILQDNGRVGLPVWSEAIVNREMLPGKVRFDSNMHLTEHQALNEYLNELVSQSLHQRLRGIPRHEILYDHPKENDEFFALSDEGKAHLDPSVIHWIQSSAHRSRGEVKVRRTVDKQTGQAKKTIIKTRIADLEIYNPQYEFDYRISISLETDWEGKTEWLTPLPESRGRNKDRMSYRHMMYQVDLTQVTHDDDGRKEHELEIEISVEKIRQELAKLRNGEPTQYEEMIRGLIDNVRLLSRRASAARKARFNKEHQ